MSGGKCLHWRCPQTPWCCCVASHAGLPDQDLFVPQRPAPVQRARGRGGAPAVGHVPGVGRSHPLGGAADYPQGKPPLQPQIITRALTTAPIGWSSAPQMQDITCVYLPGQAAHVHVQDHLQWCTLLRPPWHAVAVRVAVRVAAPSSLARRVFWHCQRCTAKSRAVVSTCEARSACRWLDVERIPARLRARVSRLAEHALLCHRHCREPRRAGAGQR